MSGHPVTGVGPGLAMCGHPGAGSCRRGKPLFGCRVTGRAEREAGRGSRATGSKLTQLGLRLSVGFQGRAIWIADAHRGDGKRYVVGAGPRIIARLPATILQKNLADLR